MSEQQKCDCCESALFFQWCDTHGIGVCTTCGLPYTIYHYEGEGEARTRVDKAPEMALTVEGLAIAKRYWTERKRRVFPAAYDMGILSRRDRSYSGATHDDIREFEDWYEQNVTAAA
jgi:hypothetical protein